MYCIVKYKIYIICVSFLMNKFVSLYAHILLCLNFFFYWKCNHFMVLGTKQREVHTEPHIHTHATTTAHVRLIIHFFFLDTNVLKFQLYLHSFLKCTFWCMCELINNITTIYKLYIQWKMCVNEYFENVIKIPIVRDYVFFLVLQKKVINSLFFFCLVVVQWDIGIQINGLYIFTLMRFYFLLSLTLNFVSYGRLQLRLIKFTHIYSCRLCGCFLFSSLFR